MTTNTAVAAPEQELEHQNNIVSADGSITAVERLLAANPAIQPDALEKFIALQERVLDRNAKQAYAASMSAAQKEMAQVTIVKDAENSQTNSKYAKLGNIIKAIGPIYTKHGLSLEFGTESPTIENTIRIVCDVTHELGYSKRYELDMPLDNAGLKGTVNKTGPHAFGSSVSYARRYLTLMIFNLALLDEDDDAVEATREPPTISELQLNSLKKELSTPSMARYFCKSWNLESPAHLWAENFDEAVQWIRNNISAGITREQWTEITKAANANNTSADELAEYLGVSEFRSSTIKAHQVNDVLNYINAKGTQQ